MSKKNYNRRRNDTDDEMNGAHQILFDKIGTLENYRSEDKTEFKHEINKLEQRIDNMGEVLYGKIDGLVQAIGNINEPNREIWWRIATIMTPISVILATLVYFAITNSVRPVSLGVGFNYERLAHLDDEMKERDLIMKNELNSRLKIVEKILPEHYYQKRQFEELQKHILRESLNGGTK